MRFTIALAAGGMSISLASTLRPQIPAREYTERRAALAARIDSGVVLAFGAVEPVVYWPGLYQLPSFQYLTGFSESDAVLLMVKREGTTTATMFVPTRDVRVEQFIGKRTPIVDIAMKVPGTTGRNITDLVTVADSLARTGLPFYFVRDHQTSDYTAEDSLTRGAHFMGRLRAAHPTLVTHYANEIVEALRAK